MERAPSVHPPRARVRALARARSDRPGTGQCASRWPRSRWAGEKPRHSPWSVSRRRKKRESYATVVTPTVQLRECSERSVESSASACAPPHRWQQFRPFTRIWANGRIERQRQGVPACAIHRRRSTGPPPHSRPDAKAGNRERESRRRTSSAPVHLEQSRNESGNGLPALARARATLTAASHGSAGRSRRGTGRGWASTHSRRIRREREP